MKIKLKRTGGVINLEKESVCELDISEDKLLKLMKDIQRPSSRNMLHRDKTTYFIGLNNYYTPIDLEKIPTEYLAFFEELVSNLKPVKF